MLAANLLNSKVSPVGVNGKSGIRMDAASTVILQ
jgi:hypothetical protein